MAIIVVGGSGRGAGKTALVCGLIRALPEIRWTAIKITSHSYGQPAPLWEETQAGQETDTARYLAAGARRALLVTAGDEALGPIVQRILAGCPPPAGVIFESNRVLRHLRPDLCLAAASSLRGEHKPSFELVLEHVDATVELAGHDHIIEAEKITFRLASLERVSPTMLEWVRERLDERQGMGSSQ
ncbi:MAG: hypothetical protein WB341_18195 [Terracidiphilus sp.]